MVMVGTDHTRVLLVPAIVAAHASVLALQEAALCARAAHVVQQDGQRAALPKFRAFGGAHGQGEAQLATHHGGRAAVPCVVANGAPAAACEHLHTAALRSPADEGHQAHGASAGRGHLRGVRPAAAPRGAPATPGPPCGPGRSSRGSRWGGRGATAAGWLGGLAWWRALGALGSDELCTEEERAKRRDLNFQTLCLPPPAQTSRLELVPATSLSHPQLHSMQVMPLGKWISSFSLGPPFCPTDETDGPSHRPIHPPYESTPGCQGGGVTGSPAGWSRLRSEARRKPEHLECASPKTRKSGQRE